jgi:hypothetical protein
VKQAEQSMKAKHSIDSERAVTAVLAWSAVGLLVVLTIITQ